MSSPRSNDGYDGLTPVSNTSPCITSPGRLCREASNPTYPSHRGSPSPPAAALTCAIVVTHGDDIRRGFGNGGMFGSDPILVALAQLVRDAWARETTPPWDAPTEGLEAGE
jgi:hypothetical protein